MMNRQEIEKKITELGLEQQWNHCIELPYGIVTTGEQQKSSGKNKVKWGYIKNDFEKLVKGCRVLDIGCNDGFFSVKAAECGAKEVVGIDIDEKRIKKARFISEAKGLGNVTFSTVDLFGDEIIKLGKFDVVLCLGIIHRVTNPIDFISRLNLFCCGTIVFEWKYCAYDILHDNVLMIDRFDRNKDYQNFNFPYFLFSYSALEEVLGRIGYTNYYRRYVDLKRAVLYASKNDLGMKSNKLKLKYRIRIAIIFLKGMLRIL